MPRLNEESAADSEEFPIENEYLPSRHNTNYNYNDDIFILWFFLKSKCKYNIITNDKYKDHIYKYNISNDIYSHLDNKIINYDLSNLYFNIKPNYTRCIQNIYDNKFAIPCINNNFIII